MNKSLELIGFWLKSRGISYDRSADDREPGDAGYYIGDSSNELWLWANGSTIYVERSWPYLKDYGYDLNTPGSLKKLKNDIEFELKQNNEE